MLPREEAGLRDHYENSFSELLSTDGQSFALVVGQWLASGAQSAVFAGSWNGGNCVCKAACIKQSACSTKAEYTMLRAFREFIPTPQPIGLLNEKDTMLLIVERLDRTLSELKPFFKSKKDQCLKLCACLVRILRHMHERGFVYVDLKPQNFMIGYRERSQVVYVVDLGCVSKAGDVTANAGTLLYTSVQSHLGKELVPAGDLESLAYLIAHL
jgi:serine/threonine protein kinase